MKVIIAGGRHYQFDEEDKHTLDRLQKLYGFTEVVSGHAPGTDRCGERWAASRGIRVKVFPADWERYSRAAGPKRNLEMLTYVGSNGLLIAFPGGAGTRDIILQATKMGISLEKVCKSS